MTESDIDDFHILPPNTDENVTRNIDIKWDLENIAKNGLFICLAEYNRNHKYLSESILFYFLN
jgi:hypothetical protein